MTNRAIFLTIAVFVGCVLSFQNCGMVNRLNMSADGVGTLQSTISGNPVNPGGGAPPPTTGLTLASTKIVNAVCSKMVNCYAGGSYSLVYDVCVNGILGTSNISWSVGAPTYDPNPFSSVVSAEQSGALLPDGNSTQNCLNDIAAETCQQIQGCYNPGSSNPFGGVTIAIPNGSTSCAAVFGPAVAAPNPTATPSTFFENDEEHSSSTSTSRSH